MLLGRLRLKETALSLQAPSDIAGYSPPGNKRRAGRDSEEEDRRCVRWEV